MLKRLFRDLQNTSTFGTSEQFAVCKINIQGRKLDTPYNKDQIAIDRKFLYSV